MPKCNYREMKNQLFSVQEKYIYPKLKELRGLMLNMHVVFMDFSVTKLKLEHINVQYLYICNDVFTFGDDDVVKQKLLNYSVYS